MGKTQLKNPQSSSKDFESVCHNVDATVLNSVCLVVMLLFFENFILKVQSWHIAFELAKEMDRGNFCCFFEEKVNKDTYIVLHAAKKNLKWAVFVSFLQNYSSFDQEVESFLDVHTEALWKSSLRNVFMTFF